MSSLLHRWNQIHSSHAETKEPMGFGVMRRGGGVHIAAMEQRTTPMPCGSAVAQQPLNLHSAASAAGHGIDSMETFTTTKKKTRKSAKQSKSKSIPMKTHEIEQLQPIQPSVSFDRKTKHSLHIHRMPGKKQKRGHVDHKVNAEIYRYQHSTDLLISRAAFARLVREIAMEYKKEIRFTKIALCSIQEATEWYMVRVLRDSNLSAMHRKRNKIEPKDMCLAQRLRGCKDKQYTF